MRYLLLAMLFVAFSGIQGATNYVVELKGYGGDVAYELMSQQQVADTKKKCDSERVLFQKALKAAEDAWRKDEEVKSKPFPKAWIQMRSFKVLAKSANLKIAEDHIKKLRKAATDKKLAKAGGGITAEREELLETACSLFAIELDVLKGITGGLSSEEARNKAELKHSNVGKVAEGAGDSKITTSETPIPADVPDGASDKVKYWIQKAAETGDADALFYCASAFMMGDGVKQDTKRGMAYTIKAA